MDLALQETIAATRDVKIYAVSIITSDGTTTEPWLQRWLPSQDTDPYMTISMVTNTTSKIVTITDQICLSPHSITQGPPLIPPVYLQGGPLWMEGHTMALHMNNTTYIMLASQVYLLLPLSGWLTRDTLLQVEVWIISTLKISVVTNTESSVYWGLTLFGHEANASPVWQMDEASTEPYHSDSGQSLGIVNFDLEPDAMGKNTSQRATNVHSAVRSQKLSTFEVTTFEQPNIQ